MWNHHDMHFPFVAENVLLLNRAMSPVPRGLDVSINAYVPTELSTQAKFNPTLYR